MGSPYWLTADTEAGKFVEGGFKLPELLVDGRQVGRVTSGTFSPVLNKSIGMGYVEPSLARPSTTLQLIVRGKTYPVAVVKLPFWKGTSGAPAAVAQGKG